MALSDNRGPAVLAVTATMFSVATVFVLLRFISRIGIVKKVTPDDYFILLAWTISFGLSFSLGYSTKFGLGKHEEYVPFAEQQELRRLIYAFTALYNPALMATKTSILVFYLTLAKNVQKTFKYTTWLTLFVVNAAGLALSLLNIFQCRPMSVLFSDPIPSYATCTDIVTLYLSSAPVNIITDIVILLLPMPVLKSMHLPRKQKWILYITFGFGIFVAVVDVVRISYLQQAAITRVEEILNGQNTSDPNKTQVNSDFSWYGSLAFMWSVIEVNVGIMVACVPALKPLVSRFVPNMIRDKVVSGYQGATANGTLNTLDMAAAQRVPSIPNNPPDMPSSDPGPGNSLSFSEFLTTPDMTELPSQLRRTDTALTNTSGLSPNNPTAFFDFMSLNDGKSIVYMTNRESVRPIAYVTVLFFLWGFAYGLLGALNGQIQTIVRETPTQAVGTHAAYYVGYFGAPLTFGRIILKRWGFKACYMVGLMIYGTGALIFWPAAVLASFPAFLVTNFIVGLGLSTLEIAANPFIALCGPPEYSEMRLNLSQGFQAIGTVISNLLAKKALFKDVLDAPSLVDVQWTYLAISLFTFVLAFVYYVIKLPEVTDEELEDSASETYQGELPELRASGIIWYTLGLGVFAQFCYVASQESVSTSLDSYIQLVSPGADSNNYEAIGEALFAASRFLAAFLGFFIKPRTQLAIFASGTIIFSALAMNFSGVTSGSMVMCVFFFEGPIFSLIFAMSIRALGRSTKDGSALITAAISGGSFMPGIMYVVAEHTDEKYAYCVPLAGFAFLSVFAIYANIIPKARRQLDPRGMMKGDFKTYSQATMGTISKHARALGRRGPGSGGQARADDADHSSGSGEAASFSNEKKGEAQDGELKS